MNTAYRATRKFLRNERGFTLIELLITMMIIAILASAVLFALYRAQETAKTQKTRALIVKLDAIIKAKWESYKTRRVPITIPPNTRPIDAAKMRLDTLRDLMRMELPDRWSDVVDNPMTPIELVQKVARPAASQGYYRKWSTVNGANSNYPTTDYQGAECLYMIVTGAMAESGDSPEVFKADSIGDVDHDGAPEFIDAWGMPIGFIRWPAGLASDLNVLAWGKTNVPPAVGTGTVTLTFDPSSAIGRFTNQDFSADPGAYVGGVIAHITPHGSYGAIAHTDNVARITGYEKTGASAYVTCAVPSTTSQPPFAAGSTPPYGDPGYYVLLGADPFDPMGVYPIYPSGSGWDLTSPRGWNIYPLIFSSGPDGSWSKVSGPVGEGIETGLSLRYSDYAMNPFCRAASNADAIGTPKTDGWQDNIHNHQIGLK